ncbi:FkbM family methyltransferase [Geomonas subterranea]|uniref:FkbM family methyltransferase n=1 Tax=Geomonas subterranea TaxID=2847989 RepID=A0ABX8LKU8_9BACT|nr:FkbM family methyltransferase [Geomonas subterranea]QXE92327.1 FkbM family methyltransferase [Geomonas subterranea]QXM09574.1 FkbM family methyltransferase [Geomonas subterranea]
MFHKIASRLNRLCHRVLARSATRRQFDLHELKAAGYYSQCGQDQWVAEVLCKDSVTKIFVDIGANDGISFSNTCHLERNLGWTGIAVEPIPEVFRKLKANRGGILVNACIAAKPGTAKFQVVSGYAEMLSGLVDEYDPQHQQRIADEIARHGGTCREIEVECCNFNELLDRHGIRKVDYLNIDTEGAEYSILKTIDFRRFEISVVGVENNYDDCRIPLLMRKNGYVLHSIVGDEFYVRR